MRLINLCLSVDRRSESAFIEKNYEKNWRFKSGNNFVAEVWVAQQLSLDTPKKADVKPAELLGKAEDQVAQILKTLWLLMI